MVTEIQLERETTIVFNDGEEAAVIWSASPSFQRRMVKLGIEPTKVGNRERGQVSCWYQVPKRWVRIQVLKPRQITEEERQRLASIGYRSLFTRKVAAPAGNVPSPE